MVEEERVGGEREPDRGQPQRCEQRRLELLGGHAERTEDGNGRPFPEVVRSLGREQRRQHRDPECRDERAPEVERPTAPSSPGDRRARSTAAIAATDTRRSASRAPPQQPPGAPRPAPGSRQALVPIAGERRVPREARRVVGAEREDDAVAERVASSPRPGTISENVRAGRRTRRDPASDDTGQLRRRRATCPTTTAGGTSPPSPCRNGSGKAPTTTGTCISSPTSGSPTRRRPRPQAVLGRARATLEAVDVPEPVTLVGEAAVDSLDRLDEAPAVAGLDVELAVDRLEHRDARRDGFRADHLVASVARHPQRRGARPGPLLAAAGERQRRGGRPGRLGSHATAFERTAPASVARTSPLCAPGHAEPRASARGGRRHQEHRRRRRALPASSSARTR